MGRSGRTCRPFGALQLTVSPRVTEKKSVSQERLAEYLRSLIERGDEFALVLKSGAPPRLHGESSVQDLGSALLDKSKLANLADDIIPRELAERLVERRHVEFGYGVDGVGRFRTTAYSQRGSLALMFRPVRLSPPAIEDLGLPDGVRALADERRGLVIVTGPPNSGCTTTLHAMVNHVNRTRPTFIGTVEEPVEVVHKDLLAVVNQLEVGQDITATGEGAQQAVRQGAEVLMVGRAGDQDAAEACLAAAEAERLVLVGVEGRDAGDAIQTFTQLFGANEHDRLHLRLAAALGGLIVQHLVPRRDRNGRVAAAEVLMATTRMREAQIEGATTEKIRQGALRSRRPGTVTLEESLAELCKSQEIDLTTAMTWAPVWHDLRQRLDQGGRYTAGAH